MDAGTQLAFAWIWLLTDYGLADGFVASCRGVIARIAPSVRVEDITHDVPSRDVRHGAAVLAQTVPYLPPSVVVAVVDPGVGTSRRAVALAAGDFVLVGPDNGLLLWAADVLGGVATPVELVEPGYLLDVSAHTFAGRDVFAPAAAHLALGIPLTAFGPQLPVEGLTRLAQPRAEVRPGVIDTEVLSIDHFGNVQFAALVADLRVAGLDHGRVQVGVLDRSYPATFGATFADVQPGGLVLFVDSAGHVALAVNGGAAAERLNLRSGDAVVIRRRASGLGSRRWTC
ncbi:MAG TPA: SAM-dependent chlorinase/fluorinase [Jiangellaceae bacterium]